jgi:hypothetical protein
MAALVDLPVLTLFSLPLLLLVVAVMLQTQETAAVERVVVVIAHHQMRLGLETHPAFPPPKATTAGWDKIAPQEVEVVEVVRVPLALRVEPLALA